MKRRTTRTCPFNLEPDRSVNPESTDGRREDSGRGVAATIHFVKGLFPRISTGEILRRVRALKPRFDGTHIRESYEELEQLGLIEAENDEDLPF